MRYQLPDGHIIERTQEFVFDGQLYTRNLNRSAEDLLAIGATPIEPPAPLPKVDSRFYYVSQIGDPTPRPIEEIRRWMKKQVRDQARDISQKFLKNFSQDIVFVLDKLADAVIDGATLTGPQKTKVRNAIVGLRRLSRLDDDKKAKEAAVDALADVEAAKAYANQLDISDANDQEDTDLS